MDYNIFQKKTVGKGKKTVKRWYYWFYKNGKQVQKVCKGCQNKAEAWAFVCALPPINREVATIREIAKDMFLPGSNHVKRRAAFGRGVLESTLKESRTYLEKIIEKWGSYDIRDIKVSDVGNYLLGVDRSGSWKKHYITVFYEIYDEAACQGLKVTLPIFPTFTRAQGKTDIFSSSELKRLFVPENFQGFAVDAETVYLLFLVSAFAGLRLGEARALRPKQFLLADKALVIDGFMRGDNVRTDFNKSGNETNRKFRIVLLPERVCGLVENYIQKRGIDAEQFLFTHENKPLRKEYLETIFRKALEKAGIDLDGRKLTPHSLRYTYVTKMRRTLPVDTVRKLVGHTAEKMTEYYTRASIEDGLAGIKDTKTAVENLFD
jgi:integrase